MHSPRKSHLNLALHVLNFLKQNQSKGVHIFKLGKTCLNSKVDVDRTRCVSTCRSVTRYYLFFGQSMN